MLLTFCVPPLFDLEILCRSVVKTGTTGAWHPYDFELLRNGTCEFLRDLYHSGLEMDLNFLKSNARKL